MRGGKLYLYVKGITREKGALYRAIAYDLDLLHDSEGLQPNGYDALYRSVTDTSLSLENRQGFSHMRLP